MQNICAATCGAMTLAATAQGSVQVSTTQTIRSAMVDIAARSRISSVRRGMTNDIVITLTAILRAAGIPEALFYSLGFWTT